MSADTASSRFVIRNELGLHFRAAAMVVRTANGFTSELTLATGKASADARSVLDLLTLAASKGTVVVVTATGADADVAVNAIGELIARNFAE